MTPRGEASGPDASAPGGRLRWLVLTNQQSSGVCRACCSTTRVGMLPSTAFKKNWSRSSTVGSKNEAHPTSHCLRRRDSIEAHSKVVIDGLHETVHLHEMRHRQTTSRSTLKATKQATTGDRRRNRVAATMPEAHWGLIHKRQVDEDNLAMSVIVTVYVDDHV